MFDTLAVICFERLFLLKHELIHQLVLNISLLMHYFRRFLSGNSDKRVGIHEYLKLHL